MENKNTDKHFVPLDELNEDEQKYLHLLVRYTRLIGKSPVDRGMMDLLNECLDKVEEEQKKYQSLLEDYHVLLESFDGESEELEDEE